MMIRSLWRGLGRNTPAPKRSISKRPAPVAIISIAQHARPNVIGHRADLRAQLTTGEAMSIAFAATVRRTKFVIESTVVRTNPSLCSAISHCRFLIANCRLESIQSLLIRLQGFTEKLDYWKPANRQSAIANWQCARPTQARLCARHSSNRPPESL